jgi:single-stranded-DNA-specific exonuclease
MTEAESAALARPRLRLRGALASNEPSDAQLESLASEWGVSAGAARLLLGRGVTELAEVRRIVDPRLRDLRPPNSMAGFSHAVEVLVDAVRSRRRVGIFGDYDVDGVTTTTILATFLGCLGVDVVSRVATRQGGYGFHVEAARAFIEAGVELVLTGDCGTSDHEALQWLADRGVHTVVIDHHQVPESMPPALALINPHQPDCTFPFKGLCSAGVAFYLCAALRTALRTSGWPGQLPDPRAWLDLVALGTVCDMVPLAEENRILVRHGLAELDRRKRPGLRALLQRAGVAPETRIEESHLGFQLGPRLNAPGRLASAEPAFNLLRARSEAEAEPFAAEVEKFNRQRRAHQEQIVAEAFALLEADPRTSERAGLVVASEAWAPGVVGVAANGLVDRYRRPTLVLAIDRGLGEVRGSVRSCGGVDVHAALTECSDLLIRHGGHPAAAGVSLLPERVDALVEAFDAAVARQRAGSDLEAADDASHDHDGQIPLSVVDLEFVESLRAIAPFGQGFAPPRFIREDVEVESVRVIKDRHLRLKLRDGDTRREAMAFGKGALPIREGERISISYAPERNDFGGRTRVQLLVDSLWR